VRARLDVNSPHAWYYRISSNYRTLVILLQVDPVSNDELETFCEGRYEIEDTSIFAWSSILSIGHYRWLRGPIYRLPPNTKTNYLVHTIRRILDFLQL
jgi:hypothetical protein